MLSASGVHFLLSAYNTFYTPNSLSKCDLSSLNHNCDIWLIRPSAGLRCPYWIHSRLMLKCNLGAEGKCTLCREIWGNFDQLGLALLHNFQSTNFVQLFSRPGMVPATFLPAVGCSDSTSCWRPNCLRMTAGSSLVAADHRWLSTTEDYRMCAFQ